ERNQGGSHGHHLARGNVHVLDLVGRDQDGLAATAALTNEHHFLGEVVVVVQRRVGLGDHNLNFVISREVVNLVGNNAILDPAVRGLDEAEGVDAAVGGQGTDQTNVGAFRGFNGAHAAVVGRVNVSNFHACTVTGETARAQRGQAALVRQAGQRVVLVHELRQLGRSEELLDRSHHGADVDQRLRRNGLDVLGGHALTHDTLHAGQAGADLVLDELAHGADAAV